MGSGRQAAQGKKGYKDQRLPKTGKPSRRTSIEPGARCNRPCCLVLSWIATCCCAVRVHSKTIPLTAVQHRTACRSLELHPEPVLCERLSGVVCRPACANWCCCLRAACAGKGAKVQTEQAAKSEKDAWEQTKPEEGADSKTRRCVGGWRMDLPVTQWRSVSCLCRVDLLALCACAAARVSCMVGVLLCLAGMASIAAYRPSTAQHGIWPTASACQRWRACT